MVIPVTNINNCSSGSTALLHASDSVKIPLMECALALGFERMVAGTIINHFPDRRTRENKGRELWTCDSGDDRER
ncbi:hypothetical protein JVU11DRAFT_9433 [Chiua virens]|nr:hypothetical protein JVU11DRAFT_9433 [Chiua virens]